MKIVSLFTLVCSTLWLTGCGGSSSSEESATYPTAYLQFYNASANSATTTMVANLTDSTNDIDIGSAGFADATPLQSLAAGSYNLELNYTSTSGSVTTVSGTTKLSMTPEKADSALCCCAAMIR